MSLLTDFADSKKASGLRYLLLIPFLLSWYNMMVYVLCIDKGSEGIYIFLNLPQNLSLIALVGAFIYFHRVIVRRVFLAIYLGLWTVCISIPLVKSLTEPDNTYSTLKTIASNLGFPFAIPDANAPLSAFNSLFYDYNYDKSMAQGSTVWSPNGGIGLSWFLLSISTLIVIALLIPSLPRPYITDEQVLLETSKPLAKPGHRLASILVDGGLTLVTCGIGWFIWSLVLWNQGQTPGKQLLKIRVYDGDTGKPARFAKMARRQFIWGNILNFIYWPMQLIGGKTTENFIWISLALYLIPGIVVTALSLFDDLLIFRGQELRRFVDRIENTYVVNEGFKEFPL